MTASVIAPAGLHPGGPVIAAAAVVAAPAASYSKPAAGAGDEVAPLGRGRHIGRRDDRRDGCGVGDKIATIEAMKMKTEVFAKGAGKVAAIAVKPGESVDTGGVLLTLA